MPVSSKPGQETASVSVVATAAGAERRAAPLPPRPADRNRRPDLAHNARARVSARGSSQSRITPPPEHSPYTRKAVWTGVPGRLHSETTQRCETGSLSVLTWDRETGDVRVSRGYCKGYRCRICGSLVARELRDRITSAVASRPWWLYLVLTFDPADFDSSWDAYHRAGKLWDWSLRKRIERTFGPVEYVQTWERHVSARQFPHLNLILTGAGLRRAVNEAGVEERHYAGAGHGRGRLCRFTPLRRWFARAAPETGFGRRVWVEVLDVEHSIAAYLAKAAQDLSAARWKAGDQTPIGAPPHFRRVRASRGLLPPVPEPDPFVEGILVPKRPDEIPLVPHVATGEGLVDPAWLDRTRLDAAAARARRKLEPPIPRFETGEERVEYREVEG